MKLAGFIIVLCIHFLHVAGCKDEASQPTPLPLVVEGDEITDTALEVMLEANPNIYIPRDYAGRSDVGTEYAIQIVKPDPSKNYIIHRGWDPYDPNTEYSMMIIDPRTQKPLVSIDPNAKAAILEEIEKRREESTIK